MRRNATRSFAAVALAALLVAALASIAAAIPVPGTYNSTDLGGSLLPGRASTSRACLHTCGGVGDVFNVLSWNGTTLQTQWFVQCGIETTPYTVVDNRVGGTGTVVYTSTFNGGNFNFNPGPWGSGAGTLGATTVISTVQFVNIGGVSTAVASRANINASGIFDYGCVLTFVIANGIGVGETDAPPPSNVLPPTYPRFLDTSCAAMRIYGSWGDVGQITMNIGCATPVRSSTWGAVKTIYR